MRGSGDYISREEAREAVWQILNGMGYSEKHNDRLVEEVDDVFDDIPAADVRSVVRGRWRKAPCHETDEAYTYVCPFCRWYMIATEPMNFCPNCGADMRGEQDV